MNTEWKNIYTSTKVKVSDAPRLLTNEEIESIVNIIPDCPSADKYAARVNRDDIMEHLRTVLKDIKICPSAIEELMDDILDAHYDSLVTPGETVGTTSAAAVGSTLTQMTLNTFHSAGAQKSATMGIDGMKDIIFAKKMPKTNICTIRYNKLKTYEEVLNSRATICGSYVSDFVKDYDIVDVDKLEKFWWHKTISVLTKQKMPKNAKKVLRLYLNIDEMYKHKVTIQDIVAVLESTPSAPSTISEIPKTLSELMVEAEYSGKPRANAKVVSEPKTLTELSKESKAGGAVKGKGKNVDIQNIFVAHFSPNSIGIIDIYPTEGATKIYNSMEVKEKEEIIKPKIKKYTKYASQVVVEEVTKEVQIDVNKFLPQEIAETSYLENFIMPDLQLIRVKGVAGITNLTPIVQPVWSAVALEEKVPDVEGGWLIYFNRSVQKRTGISPNNIAALCKRAGIAIGGTTEDLKNIAMLIKLPKDRFKTDNDEQVTISDNGEIYYLALQKPFIVTHKESIYYEVDKTLWKPAENGWIEIFNMDKTRFHHDNSLLQMNGTWYRKINKELLYIREDGEMFENITNIVPFTELRPNDYIFYKIRTRKQKRIVELEKLLSRQKELAKKIPESEQKAWILNQPTLPPDDLLSASELIYAEVNGINLRELFTIDDIDKERTTCNNMHVLTNTLGIEAARSYIIRALYDNITNYGSYVHPAHISFIAEFITSRGEPAGATYTGISRQPGGHLSLATLERAGKVFTQSAMYGKKEDIRNVSASIVVGTRIAVGNGSFDVAQDITINGLQKTYVNDLLHTHYADMETETVFDSIPENDEFWNGPVDIEGFTNLGDENIYSMDLFGDDDNILIEKAFNEEDVCIKSNLQTTNIEPGTEIELSNTKFGIVMDVDDQETDLNVNIEPEPKPEPEPEPELELELEPELEPKLEPELEPEGIQSNGLVSILPEIKIPITTLPPLTLQMVADAIKAGRTDPTTNIEPINTEIFMKNMISRT